MIREFRRYRDVSAVAAAKIRNELKDFRINSLTNRNREFLSREQGIFRRNRESAGSGRSDASMIFAAYISLSYHNRPIWQVEIVGRNRFISPLRDSSANRSVCREACR